MTFNGTIAPSHYVRARLVTIRGIHIDKVIELKVLTDLNVELILGKRTIIIINLLKVSMQSLQDASVEEESGQQYDTMTMSSGQTSTNRSKLIVHLLYMVVKLTEITVEGSKRTQALAERLGELQQLLREELAKALGTEEVE
jgi:hypothetical protein